ncbi:MAG: hypothetical protein KAI25_02715, partial [Hyphomicrobiaceae bacterium]|nr:hypothetical protein [Hyphomicrobiaceae bacterium]
MDVASGKETVMRKRTNKIKPEEGMKRSKALQIGVLAIVGAIALFGLYGCDIEEIITASGGNVSANREITQVYEIAGLLDLIVESSNGYVVVQSADSTTMSIVPGDTANVTVKAFLRSRADTLEKAQERVNAIVVEMIQTGDNLLLRYNSADQSLDV